MCLLPDGGVPSFASMGSYIKQGSKLCEGLKGLSATVEYVQLVNMVQPNTRDLMHSRNQVLRMYNKRKVRINIAKTQRPI